MDEFELKTIIHYLLFVLSLFVTVICIPSPASMFIQIIEAIVFLQIFALRQRWKKMEMVS